MRSVDARLFGLVALTMLAFAANSVLTRMGVASGQISIEGFAILRTVSGALALGCLVGWRGGRLLGWPNLWSVAALAVYIIGFTNAYVELDAGLGALVLFGVVQVTMFAGALIARERVPLLRWIGMVIALAGLALVAQGFGSHGRAQVAIMMMAAAGVGWGIYSLAGRGVNDPLRATAQNFLWASGAVLLVTTLNASGPVLDGVGAFGLATAILSGAVTSGLGYALWYHVLPRIGASRAAVSQLSVPVLAILAGNLLLSEDISMRLVLASALVLGGVAVALRA